MTTVLELSTGPEAMIRETFYVPVGGGSDRLHVRRFAGRSRSVPVLMVHGAVENGRVFYSESGRGLAPFLALSGLETFVADLRGRGLSEPHLGRGSPFGQYEAIIEDIPALSEAVATRTGSTRQLWVAHSWGGVLMLAALARRPKLRERVAGIVFFGSKRCVRVWNWERVVKIDLVWHLLAPLLVRAYGYLPARAWRIGADDETSRSHRESMAWIKPGRWIDPVDRFDYAAAFTTLELPPALFFAGAADRCLGHPRDVQDLMAEVGVDPDRVRILGRGQGHLRDYDHMEMLTHPDALQDHFPLVLDWLQRRA